MREQTKKKVGYVLEYVNDHIEENGYPPSVREICAALGLKSTSTVHIYLKALESEGKIIKSPSKPRTLRVMIAPEKTDNKDAAPQQNFATNGRSGQSGHVGIAGMSGLAGQAGQASRNGGQQPGLKSVMLSPGTSRAGTRAYPGNKDFGDDAVHVPVVGRVTAGRPILAVENIEYTFPVPSFFVNNADVFMLRVESDSMINAGIFDRDYILVRRQPTAQNGDIVVALIDDEATVKTFYKERNRVRLQPENDSYSPIYATNNCTIVGKVIGIFRKL